MVNIRKIPWSSNIDEKFLISGNYDLPIIRAQVQNNIADLWHCKSDKSEGYAVTRLDDPDEFVLVLGEGSGLNEFVPKFMKLARAMKKDVRVHVKRKGMLRMMSRHGFELDEYVMRCKHVE